MKGEALVKASVLLMALSVASKLLGFARDQTIAAVFGAGPATDAYYLGLNFAIALVSVVGGTFSTALVPVAAGLWDAKARDAWSVLRSAAVPFAGIVFAAAAGVTLSGPWLVTHVLGPGLPAATRPLAIQMVKALGVGSLFWITASVCAAVLNSRRSFVPPACGPLVLNLTIVVVILFGGRSLGFPALAAGTAAGMLAQLLVVAPFVFLAWSGESGPASPESRGTEWQLWKLMGPMLAFSVLSQMPPIVDKAVASGLTIGSVSVLSFAQKLVQLPIGLFVGAVDVVFYTALSKAWAAKDRDGAADALGLGIGILLLLMVPAAVALALLRQPVVEFVFQHGRFEAPAARLTAHTLLYYCIGLPLAAVNFVLINNAYANRNVATPLKGDAVVLVVIGIGDLLLSRVMGPAGIALAGSLGALTLTVYFVMSWDGVFRALVARSLASSLPVMAVGTICMGAAITIIVTRMPEHSMLSRLALPGVLGAVVYGLVLMIAQPREVRFLIARFRRGGAARPVPEI